MTWFKRKPPTDRSAEIDAAAAAVGDARGVAEREQARANALASRVARIHTALMHEGEANHFTQRWQRAYREAH